MDLSRYQEHYSLSHRLKRYCWYIVNRTLFRLMVTNAMKVPRNLLLRLFGANIPLASLVYPSSKIWAPWNLSVGEYACIGPDTEIYNKAPSPSETTPSFPRGPSSARPPMTSRTPPTPLSLPPLPWKTRHGWRRRPLWAWG